MIRIEMHDVVVYRLSLEAERGSDHGEARA